MIEGRTILCFASGYDARPAEAERKTAGPKQVAMLVTNRGVDDPRVCMEAETLARAGHHVTVICWDREASEDTQQQQNGVTFVRLRLRSTHGRGITQMVFLMGFWQRAWAMLRRLRPGIVHSHDLDTLPLGWVAAKMLHAKLVFDAHESFPDMMAGHLPSHVVGVLRRLELWLVPHCDLLITVGNRLAEHYRSLGARNAAVVGNWKDPADFHFPKDRIRRTRAELGLNNGVIAVCFVANLGRERRLEPLMAAVAADARFACVIGGDGPQAETVRRYAAEYPNIIYLGRVLPSRVPLITAACDVVYYGFDESNPNARWSAPNKLYEAIAAGKPILTGEFGEIGDVVRAAASGALADTRTREGVAAALEQLAPPDARAAASEGARRMASVWSLAHASRCLLQAYAGLGVQGTRTDRVAVDL